MHLFTTTLPGLAAVAALIFTWISIDQASDELSISEQGQIADRYDAAVEKLVNPSVDVRRGAIYSLQSIMADSPRTQPAVIDMLSKYIRDRATKKSVTAEKAPDVQAALYTLGNRDSAHDANAVVDLRGVRLRELDLTGVDLSRADLREAVLTGGDLAKADLSGANLESAVLGDANLSGADLTGAVVERTDLRGADLTDADLDRADLTGARLDRANLTGTTWKDTVLTGVHRPEGDLPDITSSPAPQTSRTPSPDRT
ncbi:pentapeptide repeat-containing protein [Streptomyces sp. NPDC059785]|uniref:pentapeptide repeat-containing protein n=1 Tax=unclassified Streptomyces TaxID=2593676 RepID=UPI003663F4EA